MDNYAILSTLYLLYVIIMDNYISLMIRVKYHNLKRLSSNFT